MGVNDELLRRVARESAREVLRHRTWQVFHRYTVASRDGDVLLVADPKRQKDGQLNCRWYEPLRDMGLFVAFARLPEPITEDVMVRWVRLAGTLGIESIYEERLSGFREEAREARRALRLYELATVERVDAAAIADVLGSLEDTRMASVVYPQRLTMRGRADAVRIALGEVEEIVRTKLQLHTHADVYRYASGAFKRAVGFHDLVGAIYLQARTLFSLSEIRRCQAPDCAHIIPPGSYRNKTYCSKTCSQRVRDRKKRAAET